MKDCVVCVYRKNPDRVSVWIFDLLHIGNVFKHGHSCLTYYMKHFDDLLMLQWKKNFHRLLEKIKCFLFMFLTYQYLNPS